MAERFVVAFDLDATVIIPGEDFPSQEVQDTTSALSDNGHYLSAVSARPYNLAATLAKPLSLGNNICALDGGATGVRASSGEVVWSQLLSAESVHNIVSTIGRLCNRIHFDENSRRWGQEDFAAALNAGPITRQSHPAVFAVFDTMNEADILKTLEGATDLSHEVMDYHTESLVRCIQIVSAGVNKGSGVQKMIKAAGLTDYRRVVVGDGWNDLSLLAAAGNDGMRALMGNAPEAVKAIAKQQWPDVWIAPPVQEHGFAAVMKHFRLV